LRGSPKCTVFTDADGTLWHSSPVVPAVRKLAEELGRRDLASMILRGQAERLRNSLFIEAYDWRSIVSDVLSSLPDYKARAEEHADRLLELFEEYSEELEALPGVEEALEETRGLGCSVAVVSNALQYYVVTPLRKLGLQGLFDSIITPENISIAWAPPIKPYRPIFIASMKAAPASWYAMIGDHILYDAVGALYAGLDAALILSKGRGWEKLLERAYRSAELLKPAPMDLDPLGALRMLGTHGERLGRLLSADDWFKLKEQLSRLISKL